MGSSRILGLADPLDVVSFVAASGHACSSEFLKPRRIEARRVRENRLLATIELIQLLVGEVAEAAG